MPAAGRVGSAKVARSITLSASNTHEIGIGAGATTPRPVEAEARRRQPGHLVHRGFQAEQPDLAAVMAEDAREGAPQARVRVDVVRQPVGADHRRLEGEHAAHVGLVHHPIDRAGRLQPRGRVEDVDAPVARDVASSSRPACSGRGFDQVISTFSASSMPLRAQHGRGGDVGIGVEADFLPGASRPRSSAASRRCGRNWRRRCVLWCEITTGTRAGSADMRSSRRGCRARARLRRAYASCRARRPAAAGPPAPRSRPAAPVKAGA